MGHIIMNAAVAMKIQKLSISLPQKLRADEIPRNIYKLIFFSQTLK